MKAYKPGVVKVTDEPTPVCMAPQDVNQVLVRVIGDATVYLGGADVCAPGADDDDAVVQHGFPLSADDGPLPVSCFEYDCAELYAVVAEGESGTVAFLVSS